MKGYREKIDYCKSVLALYFIRILLNFKNGRILFLRGGLLDKFCDILNLEGKPKTNVFLVVEPLRFFLSKVKNGRKKSEKITKFSVKNVKFYYIVLLESSSVN